MRKPFILRGCESTAFKDNHDQSYYKDNNYNHYHKDGMMMMIIMTTLVVMVVGFDRFQWCVIINSRDR